MVKRGALLVTLDTTRFEAGLDIARAEATRSELELVDAARELARAEELYARTVSSTTELDAARLRHARAAATHTTNQARLRIAQKTLDDASLKAPFAGVVKSVAAPGTVTTDCSLKTLVQLAR
jgi:multidrug efflux pump subunit AcrA (membrane-fusion protein)